MFLLNKIGLNIIVVSLCCTNRISIDMYRVVLRYVGWIYISACQIELGGQSISEASIFMPHNSLLASRSISEFLMPESSLRIASNICIRA